MAGPPNRPETAGPRPRPDLPAHHPQNVPLSRWSDGWLTLAISGHLDVGYMLAHEQEKRDRVWPVSRAEKIAFLVDRGDVPAAGA